MPMPNVQNSTSAPPGVRYLCPVPEDAAIGNMLRTENDARLNRLRGNVSAIVDEVRAWSNDTVVPPLVHQSWKSCTIPSRHRVWQAQCEKILPRNWSMWLWTDDANRNFIARHYPSFLDLYDGYDVKIKRIDAVRYFYLYHYGGVYMDLDMYCLRPLDQPLIDSRGRRIFPLRPGHATFGTVLPFYPKKNASLQECEAGKCFKFNSEQVHPAFMAAPPRHPFFAYLIHQLRVKQNASFRGKKAHPLAATGPVFLSNSISQWARKGFGRLHVADAPLFFTLPPAVDGHTQACGGWAGNNPITPKRIAAMIKMCPREYPSTVTTSFFTSTWIAEWAQERIHLNEKLGDSLFAHKERLMLNQMNLTDAGNSKTKLVSAASVVNSTACQEGNHRTRHCV